MSITFEDRPTDEWLRQKAGNALTHTTLRDGREVHTVIQKTFVTNYDVYDAQFAPESDRRAALERLAQGYYAFCKQTGSERFSDTYIPPIDGQEKKNLYTYLLTAIKPPPLETLVWLIKSVDDCAIEHTKKLVKQRVKTIVFSLDKLEEALKNYDDERK